MATVYITKDLIKRVQQKISSMQRAERHSDLPNIDKASQVDASWLFNVGCWGQSYVHLLETIPKSWLSKQSSADVAMVETLADGSTLAANVRFNGLDSAYARPKDGYYPSSKSELSLAFVQSLPEETVGRAELLQRLEETRIGVDIANRWAKVDSDITGFLNKCKSLNEAVKLFPAVRMYLLSEDTDRLDKKLERPKDRKQLVEAMDTDGITAAAIAAKLAQSA